MRCAPFKAVIHSPTSRVGDPASRPRATHGFAPTAAASVIVARNGFLCDALVFDRRLEHHAVGELVDHATLDLLPWRLARRILEAAGLLQSRAALRRLCV